MAQTKRRKASPVRRFLPLLLVIAVAAAVIVGIICLIRTILPEQVTYVDSPVEISEYLPVSTQFADANGELCGWVELHNTGAEAALNGWAVTVDRERVRIPDATLPADGYLRVDLSGIEPDREGGRTLRLRNEHNEVAFETVTVRLKADASALFAGKTTGKAEGEAPKTQFVEAAAPTPGFVNSPEGRTAYLASRYIDREGVVISEVMASNKFTVADKSGAYSDYIELYNPTKETVDLEHYGLTGNEEQPFKWRLPAKKLGSGETLLIFADGTGKANGDELHASFKISKDGETLLLADPAGYFVSMAVLPSLASDQAYVRSEAGTYAAQYTVSPGYPNTAKGVADFEATLEADTDPGNTLCISEVMTRNTQYAALDGKYYDWVELYNPTAAALSLKGYKLGKDPTGKTGFTLPDVQVAAGEYVLIYACGGTVSDTASVIQADFKLNGSCYVALFDPKGNRLDGMRIPGLTQNTSKGRLPGQSGTVFFGTPTPGAPNGAGVKTITPMPVFSKAAGIYNDDTSLTVELTGSGTIHYTTNGSRPTASSPVYSTPLTLTKTTVIRAVARENGALISDVATASYILHETMATDVVSITADPEDLFSASRGIYATGTHASSAFPYSGANFWQDWEREANAELLSLDGSEAGFNVGCGIKIFGAYSRAYNKKSLKLCFRDCYGTGKLNYKVFGTRSLTSFDKLVLRAGGQDSHRSVMKDELTTGLADAAGILETQAYRPVVMFLNGEYYGMYYIREKINDTFIADHCGVSEKSVDLLQGTGKNVRAGSNEDYYALIDYVKTHDLRNADAYAYVCDRVDVQNYADYVISEIWCGNTDQGNIRFYRTNEGDNKWRWILFDTDLGLQFGLRDSVWEYINPKGNGAGDSFPTTLFNGLIKNKQFRDLFVERLDYCLNNVYSAEKAVALIDELEANWHGEGVRNHKRWNFSSDWHVCVDSLRSFVRGRIGTLKKEFTTDSRVVALLHLTNEEIARCFGE